MERFLALSLLLADGVDDQVEGQGTHSTYRTPRQSFGIRSPNVSWLWDTVHTADLPIEEIRAYQRPLAEG